MKKEVGAIKDMVSALKVDLNRTEGKVDILGKKYREDQVLQQNANRAVEAGVSTAVDSLNKMDAVLEGVAVELHGVQEPVTELPLATEAQLLHLEEQLLTEGVKSRLVIKLLQYN